jgi:hypothetical protein
MQASDGEIARYELPVLNVHTASGEAPRLFDRDDAKWYLDRRLSALKAAGLLASNVSAKWDPLKHPRGRD